ncbi:MAG: iron-sulfur cluster assembly accessory protein [Candidatus Eisenbacteria bacterium]
MRRWLPGSPSPTRRPPPGGDRRRVAFPRHDHYLRIGVRAEGCSGYSCSLSLPEEREDEDRVIEHGGVRLLLDPRSEVFLKGTTLDYTSGLNGKGFVFQNPNASGTCGCGESFSV